MKKSVNYLYMVLLISLFLGGLSGCTRDTIGFSGCSTSIEFTKQALKIWKNVFQHEGEE